MQKKLYLLIAQSDGSAVDTRHKVCGERELLVVAQSVSHWFSYSVVRCNGATCGVRHSEQLE